ncbi:MAG TPA: hypothetical protein VKR31_18030 [Rhizomicrobium sp.]|nr:hypothetical protein [Rhizomicrobium sp.]
MGQPHNLTQIIIKWLPLVILTGVWVFLLARARARMSKEDQPEGPTGTGNAAAWGVAFVVLCIFFLALYWLKALSVPWTWTFDQVFAVALLLAVGLGGFQWGRIWWSGGYPAVKERVTLMGQQASLSRPKFTLKTTLFWAVIAVLLVFVVDLLQHLPA